jgi:hypothetical protein
MRNALFTLLISAFPISAATEPASHYPLKVGSKWTYRVGDKDDKFVVTAMKEEKVGLQPCMVIEAKLKDMVVATEHIAALKDGIYRFKIGEQAIEPSINIFKSGVKKGDSWMQDFKVGDIAARAKFTVDIEDVEVPAGKYKDAIVIRAVTTEKAAPEEKKDEKKDDKKDGKKDKKDRKELKKDDDKKDETVTKSTIWYVKNVGMVKQTIEIGDVKITLDLEKVDIPK